MNFLIFHNNCCRCDVSYTTSCCLEPVTVTLELRPLTHKTWLKVQAFSFNPRIRHAWVAYCIIVIIIILYRFQINASEKISAITQFMNSRLSFSDSAITIHVVSTESCDACTCKGNSDCNCVHCI